ncbi:MAG: hypothetical protein V1787_02585, partial [Candidatus Micrarchaeota archaeon]
IYRQYEFSLDAILFGTVLLVMVSVFSTILWLIQDRKLDKTLGLGRAKLLGIVLLTGTGLLLLTGYAGKVFEFINGSILTASGSNALYKTVQEGAATNAGYFPSAFGPLNPETILLLATAIAIASAFVAIWQKKSHVYALAYGAAAAAVVFFNSYVDVVLKMAADGLLGSAPEFSMFLGFLITSDVFIFMMVSMLAVFLAYLYSEEKDPLLLLTVLIVFPASYAGLSRVKYLLYVGIALTFAVPFILGEFGRIVRTLNAMFKAASEKTIGYVVIAVVLITGAWSASALYPVANASSQGLQYSRMSQDWVDSLQWIKANLNADDRVIAWWDYGHWIVFFGGSKAVIDPGNVYPEFDQEVAHGFVNGNTQELIDTMRKHGATYVLFDSELFPKWGALNYLSGTYSGPQNNYTPEIPDWELGPGRSQYEFEHSFEQIFSVLQYKPGMAQPQPFPCPGLIPRTMYYSSFGKQYCMDSGGNFTWLDGGNLPIRDPVLIRAGGENSPQLQLVDNASGIYINNNPVFINVNPDLDTITNGTASSKLFNAAFVQLYFLEHLEGFETSYKSPNSQVKIFRLVAGSAPASSMPSEPTPAPEPAALPTPTPAPEPAQETSPSPTEALMDVLPSPTEGATADTEEPPSNATG